MDQKQILRNILNHCEKFKDTPLTRIPKAEFKNFKNMIYKPIRKLELEKLEKEEIYQLKECLIIFRNQAAIMEAYDEQEEYQDQMIKFAEEQLTQLEKIVKDDSESKERSRKQKYDKKRFIWQIVGIGLAVLFSIAGLVVGIISLYR